MNASALGRKKENVFLTSADSCAILPWSNTGRADAPSRIVGGTNMKKINWLALPVCTAAALVLRVWQVRTGFEETGLPIRGSLPGLLLPLVFLAGALFFAVTAHSLPAKADCAGTIAARFPFRDALPLTAAVAGAFLLLGSAAASLTGHGRDAFTPLAPLAALAALCYLYAVAALRRGKNAQGLALVLPVCALIAALILLYRGDASDPVLAHIYVELLALAALTLCAVLFSAFAYADGAPRFFAPACEAAVLFCVPAALDQFLFLGKDQGLAGALFFAGGALLALALLAAADWERRDSADAVDPAPAPSADETPREAE